MNEIEVKILEINRKELEKKLISIGAKKISQKEIETLFFDSKDYFFKKANSLVRLRKEKGGITLTFKKLIDNKKAKIAKEYEVTVSDLDKMKDILESLGLSLHARMKKLRTSFVVNDVKFEFDKYLDEYNYIPEFLEIEANNIDILYEHTKLLGFTNEECKPWSTLDLINYYSEKNKIIKN
ncbi:class IV adenylate cyclase [[Eubacterium] cellulosolvens]